MLGNFVVELLAGGPEGEVAEVGFEDGGVDVAFAADGEGVAEAGGDGGDGLDDVLPGGGGGGGWFEFLEEGAGEDGAGPGAEVLGGEVLAGDFAEVFVDVGGVDGSGCAFGVDVLEELVAGEVGCGGWDGCWQPIPRCKLMGGEVLVTRHKRLRWWARHSCHRSL